MLGPTVRGHVLASWGLGAGLPSSPHPSRMQLGARLPPRPEAGSSHSCSDLPMAGQWDFSRLSAQAQSTQHVPTSGRACTPTTHVTSLIALQGSQPTENSRIRGGTTYNILLSRKFTLLILSERTNGNRINISLLHSAQLTVWDTSALTSSLQAREDTEKNPRLWAVAPRGQAQQEGPMAALHS